MGEVYAITGMPHSGKSNLCRQLAAALGGTAIVVRDLIRKARAGSLPVAPSTSNENGGYPAGWIEKLLLAALHGAPADAPVVFSGAAPLDHILTELGVKLAAVIVIDISDTVRREIRSNQSITNNRYSGTGTTFGTRARSPWIPYRCLWDVVPPERTFFLIGNRPAQAILRQALSAVMLTRHAIARPQLSRLPWPPEAELAEWLARLTRAAKGNGQAFISEAEKPAGLDCNRPILLFKPGHSLTAELLTAVLLRLASVGYFASGVAVWPGVLIAKSYLALAHLEHNYVLAKWAHVLSDASDGNRPGYSLLNDGRTALQLSSWWHNGPKPIKLGRAFWAKDDGATSHIVNGHVPAIVESWQQPSAIVLAIQLTAASNDAVSWESLRLDVLGEADPAQARKSSLRNMASRGELPIREPVNRTANLLHMSAGPLEALRERWLWLGGIGVERGGDLIDSPGKDGKWRYEATEHQDVASIPALQRV